MMLFLLVILVLALVGVVLAIRAWAGDGYRSRPLEPGHDTRTPH